MGHESDGAMEEVAPRLVVELFEEMVANRVGKEAHRFQDHIVLQEDHFAPILREYALVDELFKH